jgi:uncharacterized protein with HEPN domain
VKSVEVIGEAVSRLSLELKDAHSEIAWREIVGMRNRLVHVYFDIDVGLVWDTVQNDLPVLIAQIEPLVPEETD